MPITLTKTHIATHERLYPRVAALLKQVERVAGRQSTMAVPEESVRLARELCRETAVLLGKAGRGIGLPKGFSAGTLDHGALAVALGQALAGLEAFEGEHGRLEPRTALRVWQLADGTSQPMARHLKPTPGRPVPAPPERDFGWLGRNATEAREKIARRLVERENDAYTAGYRDASEGKPPREPRTEL